MLDKTAHSIYLTSYQDTLSEVSIVPGHVLVHDQDTCSKVGMRP